MKPPVNRSFLIALLLSVPIACTSEGPSPDEEQPQARETRAVDPRRTATISGRVLFEGEPPPTQEIDMSSEPACVGAHPGPVPSGHLQIDDGGGLANVFLSIESDFEGLTFEEPSEPVVIDQIGCVYTPRVVGVQQGQKLLVTNSDPVTHNVHPLPRFNRESNRTQSAGSEPLQLPFGRPETMIPVKCNLHPWMIAFVNVVSHPFFAVSATDGSFRIEGLPPGEYTLGATHERLGRQEKTVSVGPGESLHLEFVYRQETP